MKLSIDTSRGDHYKIDKAPGIQFNVRIEHEAVEGWNAAAEAIGIPRSQLVNLIGRALQEAIIVGETSSSYNEKEDKA